MIRSIIDTDLYKFTMQQAVLELYRDVVVTYKFKNRGIQEFNSKFLSELVKEIDGFRNIRMTSEEYNFIRTIPYFKNCYIEYLKNYCFDPNEVTVKLTEDNDLDIMIKGPWHSVILWEVPLMATVSEIYYREVEGSITDFSNNKIETIAAQKGYDIDNLGTCYVEFGTRRRRSFESQKWVINGLSIFDSYKGTSNVYFSMINKTMPKGTMAHEWVQGISVLEGLRNVNRFSMEKWIDVYGGNLGIALPDTYTTDVFLKDFDMKLAKLFDGVRHDSGDPIVFIDKIITHYENLGIDPKEKLIIFSDGISSIDQIKLIYNYCIGRIKCSFGIGTWFTNDFETFPLNMVIKLNSVNGIPVVKLSDSLGKTMGDEDAIKVAEWTFNF